MRLRNVFEKIRLAEEITGRRMLERVAFADQITGQVRLLDRLRLIEWAKTKDQEGTN